jgi:glycosyltransferase involved in cell wall biosynthesis
MILRNVLNLFSKQNKWQLEFAFQESSSSTRLLVVTENVNATYFLSFHYVFQLIYKKNKINFFVISSKTIEQNCDEKKLEKDIATLLDKLKPTIVIFSRYGLPYGQKILQSCQAKKIPTVYHIDDDLLEIPLVLGEKIQKQHGNRAVIQEREYLLANVDLIYASTQYLEQKLSQRFPAQKTYYGMSSPYLATLIKPKERPYNNHFKFGYMGSKGHKKDLESIASAIAQILTDYPNATFETFGTIALPDSLQSFSDRITSHKVRADYASFLQHLYELNWDLGLAPLEDTEFNNCKTPTKYIEYTACDIPTLASNCLVYDRFVDGKEIMLAEGDRWYEKIKLFIEQPNLKYSLLEKAKTRCSQQFSLENLEKQIDYVISLVINK